MKLNVAWSPSGNLLASCSRDRTVWIWDCSDIDEYDCLSVLHGHTQDVKYVYWHPYDEILYSTSYDNSTKIWIEESDDWYNLETIQDHQSTVWQGIFNKLGNQMITISDDLSIILYQRNINKNLNQLNAWNKIYTLENAHTRSIYSIDWYKDYIVTAGADNCINIYHINNNQIQLISNNIQAHNTDINCVKFLIKNEDEIYIISTGDDQHIKIRDIPYTF